MQKMRANEKPPMPAAFFLFAFIQERRRDTNQNRRLAFWFMGEHAPNIYIIYRFESL
jgi:hypothetical protein